MKFKVFRDWLQQTIYKIINPIVHGMIKIGITPNFITTTGLILNIVAACRQEPSTQPIPFWPLCFCWVQSPI